MSDFVVLLSTGTEPTNDQLQAAATAINGEVLDRDLYFVGKLSDDGTLTMSALAQIILATRYSPTVDGWGPEQAFGPIASRDDFKARRIALLDQGAEHIATEVTQDGYLWRYHMPEQVPNPETPDAFIRRHIRDVIADVMRPMIEEFATIEARGAKEAAEAEYQQAVERGKAIADELISQGEVV